MSGGVYIAAFLLRRSARIRVGRLGRFDFPRGVYFYVGSAQVSADARLARHARAGKPLHWHIDYLSAKAEMVAAVVVPGRSACQCRLAAALSGSCQRHVKGFGASDCRCGGHLFRAAEPA